MLKENRASGPWRDASVEGRKPRLTARLDLGQINHGSQPTARSVGPLNPPVPVRREALPGLVAVDPKPLVQPDGALSVE